MAMIVVLAFALCSLAQTGDSSTGGSGSSMGQAGASDQTGGKKGKSKSSDSMGDTSAPKATSVTGCLNGSAGSYTLTNGRYKNGVAVTAASGVDLAPHVGHTVRLTGTWEKGSGSSAAGGTAASKIFNATGMKHISETCTTGTGSKAAKSGSKSDSAAPAAPK